jgi:hypothetical protein
MLALQVQLVRGQATSLTLPVPWDTWGDSGGSSFSSDDRASAAPVVEAAAAAKVQPQRSWAAGSGVVGVLLVAWVLLLHVLLLVRVPAVAGGVVGVAAGVASLLACIAGLVHLLTSSPQHPQQQQRHTQQHQMQQQPQPQLHRQQSTLAAQGQRLVARASSFLRLQRAPVWPSGGELQLRLVGAAFTFEAGVSLQQQLAAFEMVRALGLGNQRCLAARGEWIPLLFLPPPPTFIGTARPLIAAPGRLSAPRPIYLPGLAGHGFPGRGRR